MTKETALAIANNLVNHAIELKQYFTLCGSDTYNYIEFTLVNSREKVNEFENTFEGFNELVWDKTEYLDGGVFNLKTHLEFE